MKRGVTVNRWGESLAKTPSEESGKNLGQAAPMPSSQIIIYIKFRQPVTEKILSEGTRRKDK